MVSAEQLRAKKDLPAVNRRGQVDMLQHGTEAFGGSVRYASLGGARAPARSLSMPPALAENSGRRSLLTRVGEIFRVLATLRIIRYGLVGTGAALLQLGLLAIFVEILQIEAVLASTAALAISVVVNYALQRHFTFRSKSRHVVAGPRFIVLTLATLATNGVLFSAISTVLPYLLSQIITTATIFPVNYYLNKTVTFRA